MYKINPTQIKEVMTLALEARERGENYVPCFAGDAGIGKSEVTQSWCKEQGDDFQFIDIRLAYMERPDLIGMPSDIEVNGEMTTIHALPEFLPRNGRGLILFEEPNRANESTMNGMMQILTDRKIHKYKMPEGYIMAACINPEGRYNVNTLDPALKNRFAMFEVVYDHNSFVKYIQTQKWDPRLIGFVDKYWSYKSVDEIGDDEEKYISPRSLKQVNVVLKSGAEKKEIFPAILAASLGKTIGADFLKFLREHRPVLLQDFIQDEKAALQKLKTIAEDQNYQGDLMSLTVSSVIDGYNNRMVSSELVTKIINVLTVDQGINLLLGIVEKVEFDQWEKFKKEHKNLFQSLEKRQNEKL